MKKSEYVLIKNFLKECLASGFYVFKVHGKTYLLIPERMCSRFSKQLEKHLKAFKDTESDKQRNTYAIKQCPRYASTHCPHI